MNAAPARVLIVDDDVKLALALESMLETTGTFEIRVEHCVADAVAAAELQKVMRWRRGQRG